MIKAFEVRRKVKPGITGWARVNGHRGQAEMIEKMQAREAHDLQYLRNWSPILAWVFILGTVKSICTDAKAF